MRLVRLGPEPSAVGADVRAALSAWGNGAEIVGGIALTGVTPPGFTQAVDAVIILPRGILVVVGVDLPDPAVRLEAPLDGIWKVDNWDLVRPDGLRNPATEALQSAAEIDARLQSERTAPLPVCTVVAVGPYVGRVVQPSSDLNRGIRVLHPSAGGMLSATRELATSDRPCSLEQARSIMQVIGGKQVDLTTTQLAAEGFPDAVSPDIASASTLLLPKVVEPAFRPGPASMPQPPAAPPRPRPAKSPSRTYVGLAVAGLILVILVAVLARSCGSSTPVASGTPTTTAPPTASTTTNVDGVTFTQEASDSATNCAQHSFGDVQVWLGQHPCLRLHRGLYRAEGQSTTAALAVVTFADEATADQFTKLLLSPGAGSVSDLVRDGKFVPDGPLTFDGAAYTVVRKGNGVHIAQAVFVGKPSRSDDENLRAVADRAVQLPAPS